MLRCAKTSPINHEHRRLIRRVCSIPGVMRTGKRAMTGRVKVYRFWLYDIASEDFKISRGLPTPACIKRIRAELIHRTELEIDKKDLSPDGMTELAIFNREPF